MKRMILRIVVMLVTFALGVAVDWSIIRRAVNNTSPTPTVEVVNPAPLETSIAPVVSVAAAAPLPAETQKPHFILDYDPDTFNPYGTYYLMGPKPKGFENLDNIEVGFLGYPDNDPGTITVYKRYPDGSFGGPSAFFGLVTKRRLVFATSKSSDTGVEYRFEGEFLRTDLDHVNGKNIAVLRGVLTRSKDGRALVQRTVSFSYVYHGC